MSLRFGIKSIVCGISIGTAILAYRVRLLNRSKSDECTVLHKLRKNHDELEWLVLSARCPNYLCRNNESHLFQTSNGFFCVNCRNKWDLNGTQATKKGNETKRDMIRPLYTHSTDLIEFPVYSANPLVPCTKQRFVQKSKDRFALWDPIHDGIKDPRSDVRKSIALIRGL
eukprot:88788_1